jgi:hypothetical protein
MVETLVLVTFATALVIGIVAGIPLLAILIGGFFLFAGYGLYRGNSVRSVLSMAGEGLRTIGSVLMLFVIIGMLTASWRAAGTIPAITCWSTKLVSPPTQGEARGHRHRECRGPAGRGRRKGRRVRSGCSGAGRDGHARRAEGGTYRRGG